MPRASTSAGRRRHLTLQILEQPPRRSRARQLDDDSGESEAGGAPEASESSEWRGEMELGGGDLKARLGPRVETTSGD
jgi:hypothetical protein